MVGLSQPGLSLSLECLPFPQALRAVVTAWYPAKHIRRTATVSTRRPAWACRSWTAWTRPGHSRPAASAGNSAPGAGVAVSSPCRREASSDLTGKWSQVATVGVWENERARNQFPVPLVFLPEAPFPFLCTPLPLEGWRGQIRALCCLLPLQTPTGSQKCHLLMFPS